jgi:hypothetical protein
MEAISSSDGFHACKSTPEQEANKVSLWDNRLHLAATVPAELVSGKRKTPTTQGQGVGELV